VRDPGIGTEASLWERKSWKERVLEEIEVGRGNCNGPHLAIRG